MKNDDQLEPETLAMLYCANAITERALIIERNMKLDGELSKDEKQSDNAKAYFTFTFERDKKCVALMRKAAKDMKNDYFSALLAVRENNNVDI